MKTSNYGSVKILDTGISEPIDTQNKKLCSLIFPSGLTSSTFGFKVSIDTGITYEDYYIPGEKDITTTIETTMKGTCVPIGIGDFYGCDYVKIVLNDVADENKVFQYKLMDI